MKNLNPLSREEMKKVNGGTEPVCNVGAGCSVFIQHVGVVFGSCATENNRCVCTREWSGQVVYGDATYCTSVS